MLQPISEKVALQHHTSKSFQISQTIPPFRSSHQKSFMKKLFLKIWQYSQYSITMLKSLFTKVAGLIRKGLQDRCFSMNVTTFQEHLFSRTPMLEVTEI